MLKADNQYFTLLFIYSFIDKNLLKILEQPKCPLIRDDEYSSHNKVLCNYFYKKVMRNMSTY